MAISSNLGCEINTVNEIRKDSFLFGESQGRVIVTVSSDQIDSFKNEIKTNVINSLYLGKVSKESQINIDSTNYGMVEDFKEISNNVINL